MKRYILKLLMLAFPGALCAREPLNVQGELDGFANKRPGGAIAVAWVDAGGERYYQSGRAAAGDLRAVTSDTLFEIGSITKVFTAVLLAESEQLGRVRMDDPAAKYLLAPDDPAQAELAHITLRGLSTHTTGLLRLPLNLVKALPPLRNPYARYGSEDLIAALKEQGPKAKAGRRLEYSNFGVSVLGEALGKAWGSSYEETLREHVLNPLGMEKTSLAMTGGPAVAELACGHNAKGRAVDCWTFQACAPAGALRSSTREMAIFLKAAMGGGPLVEAFAITTARQGPGEGAEGKLLRDSGLGWFFMTKGGRTFVWHNGGTGGFRSFIGFERATKRGVVVLASRADDSVDEIGLRMLLEHP